MTSSDGSAADLTLYGAAWCPDCRRSKAFLAEQRIPFRYVDLEVHPEENDTVERYNDGKLNMLEYESKKEELLGRL